jgi:hypothetical protein
MAGPVPAHNMNGRSVHGRACTCTQHEREVGPWQGLYLHTTGGRSMAGPVPAHNWRSVHGRACTCTQLEVGPWQGLYLHTTGGRSMAGPVPAHNWRSVHGRACTCTQHETYVGLMRIQAYCSRLPKSGTNICSAVAVGV